MNRSGVRNAETRRWLALVIVSILWIGSASVFAQSFQGLGDLSGGSFDSYAFGLSADGSVVVGYGNSTSGKEAFVWDAAHGMRSLRTVLVNVYGLDLAGWTLTEATGVSSDGTTIVGYGADPGGHTEAWLAQIPEPGTWLLVVLGGVVLKLGCRFARR